MRTSRPVLLVLVALAAGACGGAPRPGAVPAAGARQGTIRFARALEGAVVPGPVIGRDGSVLAASNGGVLHALDPATGRDRWRFDGGGPYGSDLSTSPLVLADGRIVWPGPRDSLFLLDGGGRLLARASLGAQAHTPLRGPGDAVYVQDAAGGLHRFTAGARSLRERWRVTAGDATSYASPVLGRDGTIYTTVGRELVAVRDRGRSGAIRWRFAARADVEVSPAVAADGTIVLGTNDAFQYGVSPAGRERWRWRREIFTYSSPLTTPDGRVRFGDHRGRLITLDGRTGRLLQSLQGHGQVWTRPAVDRAGRVYWGTTQGEVFGFDRHGRRVLHVTTGARVDSYPAVGPGGTVYVGSEDGHLYALAPAVLTNR